MLSLPTPPELGTIVEGSSDEHPIFFLQVTGYSTIRKPTICLDRFNAEKM